MSATSGLKPPQCSSLPPPCCCSGPAPAEAMDPAIVIFGLGIGVLVGMTGMGGASLMTPLLILVFGISPVTAIGTDIFYAAITKTVGGYQHLKLKTVHLS